MWTYLGRSPADGCPGLCSGHGRCTLEQSGWRCVCQAGWSGPGCNVVMETDCSDGTDNDGGDILTSSIIFSLLPPSLMSFWQLLHSSRWLLLLCHLTKHLPESLSLSVSPLVAVESWLDHCIRSQLLLFYLKQCRNRRRESSVILIFLRWFVGFVFFVPAIKDKKVFFKSLKIAKSQWTSSYDTGDEVHIDTRVFVGTVFSPQV